MYNIFVSLQRLQVLPCCSLFCFLSQVLVFFPLLSILYTSFPGTGFSFMGAGSFTPSDFVEFIFSFIYFLSVILSHVFLLHPFVFISLYSQGPDSCFLHCPAKIPRILPKWAWKLHILTELSKWIRIIPSCNVFLLLLLPLRKHKCNPNAINTEILHQISDLWLFIKFESCNWFVGVYL